MSKLDQKIMGLNSLNPLTKRKKEKKTISYLKKQDISWRILLEVGSIVYSWTITDVYKSNKHEKSMNLVPPHSEFQFTCNYLEHREFLNSSYNRS